MVKEVMFKRKKELIIVSILLIVLTLISVILYSNFKTKNEIVESNDLIIAESSEKINDEVIKETIMIDIKGEVKTPGVYKLDKNSRVIDAITLAGGLTKNAYTKYINLSKILEDQFVIIIDSKNDIKKVENKTNIEEIKLNTNNNNDASIKQDNIITNDKEDELEKENIIEENIFVNINTSTKESLMTLPGVGESKALAIIEYRTQNGNFKDIKELKNVSGIGDKLYEDIKMLVTV